MNSTGIQKSFNYLIVILLVIQSIIFIYNSKAPKNALLKISNSVERFTTMVSGDDGVDIVSADKLIKVNDDLTLLSGEASLKNNEYEIKSSDVTVDSKNKKTFSENRTITKNKQGTVISDGFEYDQESGIIFFNGESEFYAD